MNRSRSPNRQNRQFPQFDLDTRALRRFGGEAPTWMENLALDYARRFLPKHIDDLPTIALVPKPKELRFGGRHIPEQNAILVYDTGDQGLTEAVELHELTHWARKRLGDPKGKHDRAFYRFLEAVFRYYGVPSKVARQVEQICDEPGSPCEHWGW